MELGCHSKKSGNGQTVDRDNANSVQEFGDCFGDKHSFCQLLAISYMVVTVKTHTNKLILFRQTNQPHQTSCCSHIVCIFTRTSPSGSDLGQTGSVELSLGKRHRLPKMGMQQARQALTDGVHQHLMVQAQKQPALSRAQQSEFQIAEVQDHGWDWGNTFQIQCFWTSDSCVKLMKNSII